MNKDFKSAWQSVCAWRELQVKVCKVDLGQRRYFGEYCASSLWQLTGIELKMLNLEQRAGNAF